MRLSLYARLIIYSSLKPLPPCICTPSSTIKSNTSLPSTFSIAHSMANSSAEPRCASANVLPDAIISVSLSSIHLLVRYNALSLTHMRVAHSASLCLIAPKFAMAVLNCSRVLAYFTTEWKAILAPPNAAAHNFNLPIFKILKAIMCPLPISPNRFSTGTLQS